MTYLALKHFHMTCALLSGLFFLVRGCWMMAGSALLQRRWVKIAPHVIDTLLLASALALTLWSSQYPFVQSWLSAKLLALLLYIALGTVALKRGKTKGMRIAAFIGALAAFGYIVAVALSKQPWPFS